MKLISRSGHVEYSMVLASKMFQGGHPNSKEIKFILRKASKHGSDGAMYFMMMLLVLSKDGSFVEDSFFIFQDLFNHRQLAKCKGDIIKVEGPPTGSLVLLTKLVGGIGGNWVFIGHSQVATMIIQ